MKSFGFALSCVYALGIIAVQVNLLRFGILDLTAVDIYYFVVGVWVVLSLLPCVLVLSVLELSFLAGKSALSKALFVLVITSLAGLCMWILQYRAQQYVLNFNAYPYPKWYVYWNIFGINLTLFLIWLALVRARKMGWHLPVARGVGLALDSVAVLVFTVFFGRTVYPALDRGVGGGAPQFALISLDGGQQKPVMLVHVSDSYVYFIELPAFPGDLESREPAKQYATDRSGPVYCALTKNVVARLSHNKVSRIDMIGFNQKPNIERYLFEGRYFFWQ